MKEIKIYKGAYILNCGTPYLLINYWESNNKYNCEIFVIFEKYDSTLINIGRRINIDKDSFEDLNHFFNFYALSISNNIIYNDIIISKICIPGKIQVPDNQPKLEECKKTSWLLILNQKFNGILIWIKNNSSVDELNETIDLVLKSQIDTTDF